jgi:hypothetical protein
MIKTRKKPACFWLRSVRDRLRGIPALRVLGYASLPLFALFCQFVMEYMNASRYGGLEGVTSFVSGHPAAALFGALVMLALLGFLLLLCRKAVIACGLLGLLAFGSAVANYLKSALNGDNFFPRDLHLAASMEHLLNFADTRLPGYFWLALAVCLLWLAALALLGTELPLRWYIRVPGALCLALAVCLPMSTAQRAEKILNSAGMYYEDAGLQSSNYRANGFIGAFMVNLLSMNVTPPADYTPEGVEETLSAYEATPAARENYDVLCVLCESLFDVRALPGFSFSDNPLKNYDRLLTQDNCWSGTFYSTAVCGGTVRPEFDVLTGLTTDGLPSGSTPYEYVSGTLESYVSNYKAAGYTTIALHLYDTAFYGRDRAYPLLGFDEYYGLEDLYNLVTLDFRNGYATDDSTERCIEYLLERTESPVFLFVITIENHQPYRAMSDNAITVTSSTVSGAELAAVETYTQGAAHSDALLGSLADYVDNSERPAVLAFFGDHKPTLGSNLGVYQACGAINASDGLDTEESLWLYSTPWLIYSNRELTLDGMFSSHTGNDLSSYHLLNAVAVGTGFSRTPYMNFLLDFYKAAPMYNVRLQLPLTETTAPFAEAMKCITYDRLFGGND